MKKMSVLNLIYMAIIHFIIMYLAMYSMVDTFDNIFPNLNHAYMAGIMTAPMLLFEAIFMKSMYEKKSLMVISIIGVIVLVFSFVFIRQQTLIKDEEFIRSMIPHHSGAILMCKEANLNDAELKELCKSIIEEQQSEINQMKRILSRLP